MIYYESGGLYILLKLFKCRGSTFATTTFIALPVAIIAGVLQQYFPDGSMPAFGGGTGILRETQAWGGFSFLVGFLIVFRTSQAYNRFWEGCSASYRMQAEWFDAAGSVLAFTKHNTAPYEDVIRFKELVIRLTSMLHAAALAELEAGETKDTADLWAHSYELIDPTAVDSRSIETIKLCRARTELLFSWLQQVVVENINTGVLSIPSPILSRYFQELANGMVAFHDAMRISYVPFPFPYAQACDCILVIHWMLVPFVTSQWVTDALWAAVFTFIQVFILWTLNLTAIEIDHPFGKDANDIDGERMQIEFNNALLVLLSKRVERTPSLSSKWAMTSTEDIVLESRNIPLFSTVDSEFSVSRVASSLRGSQDGGPESPRTKTSPGRSPSTFDEIFNRVTVLSDESSFTRDWVPELLDTKSQDGSDEDLQVSKNDSHTSVLSVHFNTDKSWQCVSSTQRSLSPEKLSPALRISDGDAFAVPHERSMQAISPPVSPRSAVPPKASPRDSMPETPPHCEEVQADARRGGDSSTSIRTPKSNIPPCEGSTPSSRERVSSSVESGRTRFESKSWDVLAMGESPKR